MIVSEKLLKELSRNLVLCRGSTFEYFCRKEAALENKQKGPKTHMNVREPNKEKLHGVPKCLGFRVFAGTG